MLPSLRGRSLGIPGDFACAVNPHVRLFLDRIRAGLADGLDLSHMSDWMKVNTKDPANKFRPWSFAGHEFQEGIVNDTANDQVTMKCSQIGVSEIYARLSLGMLTIMPSATCIYTLPTAGFASRFAKQRLDLVIENSEVLNSRIHKDTNNTSQKRLGDSFLYITGTFTKGSAISIPAQILINDEVDFSNPETLSSFDSRLGHQKEDELIRRRFSTPTVFGYGVEALYKRSDQKIRAVHCDHCGTWQTPTFSDNVVVPGLERDLAEFTREDLDDERIRIDEAYLACPGCGAPLSTQNLADPAKREWVARLPGERRSGFFCQPFEVPHINTIPRVLRSIENYERVADWWNFKVGVPFEDSETSFTEESVKQSFSLQHIQPAPNAATGTVIGIDTGKTCWITVGKPINVTSTYVEMDIIHAERFRVEAAGDLGKRAAELAGYYGSLMVVTDAGPEWNLALAVRENLSPGKAFACYYVKKAKTPLSNMDVNADDQVVNVTRTDVINMTAKSMNANRIRYPRGLDERPTIISHLRSLKRITLPAARGNENQDVWINTGPDHFGHSLVYTVIAAVMTKQAIGVQVVPGLPLAAKVKVGGSEEPVDFYSGRSVRVTRYG